MADEYKEAALIEGMVPLLMKSGKPQDYQRIRELRARIGKRIFDKSQCALRMSDMAEMNKTLQMFRNIHIKLGDCNDLLLNSLLKIIEGDEDVTQVEFAHIVVSESSSTYAALLRCITSLKNLRRLAIMNAPLSQSFFAAIYVSNIRELELGQKTFSTTISPSSYHNLCLFLQGYPKLTKLNMNFVRDGDPGLTKIFAALKKNPNLRLDVRSIF